MSGGEIAARASGIRQELNLRMEQWDDGGNLPARLNRLPEVHAPPVPSGQTETGCRVGALRRGRSNQSNPVKPFPLLLP